MGTALVGSRIGVRVGEASTSGVGEASTSGVGEASTSGVGEALTSGVGEALTSGVGETSTSGVGEGCDRLLLTGLRFLGLGGDNSGVGVSFGDSGNTEGEEVGCDRSFVPK